MKNNFNFFSKQIKIEKLKIFLFGQFNKILRILIIINNDIQLNT